MALIYRLSQFRDIFVSNLCTKILGINNNNKLSKDYCLLIFLNFIPYFIISFFLNLLQVQYLYKKDDIIYYSNENDTVLGPILLEAYLNNNDIIQKKVSFARIIELINIIHKYFFFSSNSLNFIFANLLFRLIFLR